ncbi:MAG: hypothetical protein Q8847_02525, partial [Sweet potato little leaf phytoplasma]|nr:hypothetical protein [Sweet potato little leaf phytoplasma]
LKLKIGVGRDRNIPLSQYVLKKMNQKDIDLIHLNFVLFKRLNDHEDDSSNFSYSICSRNSSDIAWSPTIATYSVPEG